MEKMRLAVELRRLKGLSAAAAKILGIDATTLQRKRKRYGLA